MLDRAGMHGAVRHGHLHRAAIGGASRVTGLLAQDDGGGSLQPLNEGIVGALRAHLTRPQGAVHQGGRGAVGRAEFVRLIVAVRPHRVRRAAAGERASEGDRSDLLERASHVLVEADRCIDTGVRGTAGGIGLVVRLVQRVAESRRWAKIELLAGKALWVGARVPCAGQQGRLDARSRLLRGRQVVGLEILSARSGCGEPGYLERQPCRFGGQGQGVGSSGRRAESIWARAVGVLHAGRDVIPDRNGRQ